MNACTLRGVAVLALACFALPRAEAVMITFNPATTATYLDATIRIDLWDFNQNWVWASDPSGWSVGASAWVTQYIAWFDIRSPFPNVSAWVVVSTTFVPGGMGANYYDSVSTSPVQVTQPVFALLGSPAVPTAQRVTWDMSSVAPASVPDAGTTAGMLAEAVAVMGVALLIHRRRETPSPRALRGV